MVTVIKQGSTRDIINELLVQLFAKRKVRGIDAKKYCGKLNLKDDSLLIQKNLRDEWE